MMNQITPDPKLNLIGEPAIHPNVEFVIQTLWLDLPTLFERDISYTIYTNDIFFQDPVNTFKGKLNYRIIFWTLRFHARLFFTQIFFDLHDISQPTPTTLLATWTVRGSLRVPWSSQLFFNGTSTYTLTSDGLINRHIDTWDRSPLEIVRQFLRPGSRSLQKPEMPDPEEG
jgi:hypothetical protein